MSLVRHPRRVAVALTVALAAHGALPRTATAQSAPAQGTPVQGTPKVTEQQSHTTQLLQAVHAVDSRVVWASGHGGVVLRTLDGGTTWERRPAPAGDSLEYRDVHALSADVAWVLAAGNGAKSRIYRTTDGGATWTPQFVNADTAAFYDCLSFLDRRTGVAVGDAVRGQTRILRTTSAGQRWALVDSSFVPAALPSEGAFASSGQCAVAADATTAYIAMGAPGARLFRSTDAGAHWTALPTPFVKGTVAGLTGLAFTSATRGIAVAADINRLRTDTSSAVVGVTEDGGQTWTLRPRPPLPGALSGVAWVTEVGKELAVVVGFGGAFITPDAGRNWITLNNQVFTGVAAFGRSAWIAGGNGRIIRLDW